MTNKWIRGLTYAAVIALVSLSGSYIAIVAAGLAYMLGRMDYATEIHTRKEQAVQARKRARHESDHSWRGSHP